jgi:hypothetical protein
MALTDEVKMKISQYANLHQWFAFKDWVSANNNFSSDEKASIISYGLSLMMNRYHESLP